MRYSELLSATLSDGLGDRLPVAAWQHHPVADQETESFVDSTLAFQARFDFDLVKLTPASTWQARDHGLQDAWEGDAIGRRRVLAPVITAPDQWDRIAAIDPKAGFSGRIVAAAARLRRHLPGHIPLLATVFNPVFQASQLRGTTDLLADSQHHPDRLRPALDRLRDNTVATIRALRDTGIDGIFYVTQHAQAAVTTARQWQQLSLADDIACLAAAAGLSFNMLHLHGAAVHTATYAECNMPLHYDHTDNNPYPDDLIRYLPAGLSTGPSARTIAEAMPADLIRQIMRLRQTMAGQRFVLAPGCAIPLAARPDQIATLAFAARQPLRLAA